MPLERRKFQPPRTGADTFSEMLFELKEKRRKGRLTYHHMKQKGKPKKGKPNTAGSKSRVRRCLVDQAEIARGEELVKEYYAKAVAAADPDDFKRRLIPADDFGTGPDRMRRIQDDAARQLKEKLRCST